MKTCFSPMVKKHIWIPVKWSWHCPAVSPFSLSLFLSFCSLEKRAVIDLNLSLFLSLSLSPSLHFSISFFSNFFFSFSLSFPQNTKTGIWRLGIVSKCRTHFGDKNNILLGHFLRRKLSLPLFRLFSYLSFLWLFYRAYYAYRLFCFVWEKENEQRNGKAEVKRESEKIKKIS